MSDLKPCPFCGEREHLYPSHHWPGTGAPYGIDCLGCGIDFTPREGMDVIAAWNRRAADNQEKPS
jgi:Lar family restriction alleviation protein